jgi:hypothetical protein
MRGKAHDGAGGAGPEFQIRCLVRHGWSPDTTVACAALPLGPIPEARKRKDCRIDPFDIATDRRPRDELDNLIDQLPKLPLSLAERSVSQATR